SSKTLKKLMRQQEPSYLIPTRNYFRDNIIKNAYEKVKLELQGQMKEAGFIAITTDMWTSDNKINHIAITTHFVDDHYILQNKAIKTLDYNDEHNADGIKERISKTLIDWKLLDIVICVVSDNTNIKVGRDLHLGWTGSFSHLLQTVIGEGSAVPNIRKRISS
ncbi:unnamed protein product, partial [Didymodactylos carnosus]